MRYYLLGFLLIIAVLSCHNDHNDSEEYKTNENLPQLRSEWAREYEAWKNLDIQNYQYIFSLPDSMSDEWGLRITVKNGQFHEAIDIITGDDQTEGWGNLTIDGIFLGINDAFDRDEKKEDLGEEIGTSFYIIYDSEYHFPALFSITRIYNHNHLVGGNGSETVIKDFAIIEDNTDKSDVDLLTY